MYVQSKSIEQCDFMDMTLTIKQSTAMHKQRFRCALFSKRKIPFYFCDWLSTNVKHTHSVCNNRNETSVTRASEKSGEPSVKKRKNTAEKIERFTEKWNEKKWHFWVKVSHIQWMNERIMWKSKTHNISTHRHTLRSIQRNRSKWLFSASSSISAIRTR